MDSNQVDNNKNEEQQILLKATNNQSDSQDQQQLQQQCNNTICSYRTPFCQHKGGCLVNFYQGILHGLKVGYIIRVGVNALVFLLSLKKGKSAFKQGIIKTFFNIFFDLGNIRLPITMATQNGFLKGFLCLLRILRRKDDGFNAFASAFASSVMALLIQKKENYYLWRMFLGSRALQCTYLALVNRGYLPKTHLNYSFMFMICSYLISYCYFHESINLETDLIKLYKGFDHLGPYEKNWHYCEIQRGLNLKDKLNLLF